MPQLHLTRRTGRRLLAGGVLGAVVVLGTPAVASADTEIAPGVEIPIDIPGMGSGDTGDSTGDDSGTPGPEDVENAITAGAECFSTAGADLQVAITGLGTDLTTALAGLLGQSPISLPVDGSGDASGVLQLDQGDLEDALAGGADSLTMVVTVIVDGVQQVVQVVIDLAECLAALIPTSLPTTVAPGYTPPTTAAPTTTVAPAVTTSAAPTQAVAYPGYAPTGGAPSDDDGSPAALVGLGLLTAATGGGALWLRARRGVA